MRIKNPLRPISVCLSRMHTRFRISYELPSNDKDDGFVIFFSTNEVNQVVLAHAIRYGLPRCEP